MPFSINAECTEHRVAISIMMHNAETYNEPFDGFVAGAHMDDLQALGCSQGVTQKFLLLELAKFNKQAEASDWEFFYQRLERLTW